MSSVPEPDITLDVDLRNPGQFFACCGLLELAGRVWPASEENGWREPEGWFVADRGRARFQIASYSRQNDPLGTLADKLCDPEPIVELAEDHEGHSGDRKPVVLKSPFHLRLDWWLTSFRGRGKSELKVWAGQMTPKGNLGLLKEMWRELAKRSPTAKAERLLSARVPGSGMGIDPGTTWTAINVGFSPDEQNMPVLTAPATEILAMIGLQRFRPVLDTNRRGRWFIYRAWADPAAGSVAPAALAGVGRAIGAYTFQVQMRNAQYGNFGWANPREEER